MPSRHCEAITGSNCVYRASRSRPCVFVFASVLLALTAVPALAQPNAPNASDNAAQAKERGLAEGALAHRKVEDSGPADVKHGEQIALGKTGCANGGVCGCFQCHGLRGEGNPSSGFPRIGSQSYLYLDESLHNFAAGRRTSEIMQPIARQLSDTDMRDVAGYYATLQAPDAGAANAAAAKNQPDPELLTEGGVLAAIGSAKDGVQGCQNCHGPAGAGLPPVYPSLAGQYASYLEDQLHMFKNGKRHGDAFAIMQDIAHRLSDKQIKAVAAYYASIRPERTVTQSKLGPAAQIGAPLGPQHGQPHGTSGRGQQK